MRPIDKILGVLLAFIMIWVCFDHVHSPLSNALPLWWRVGMSFLMWACAGFILFMPSKKAK